MKNIKNKKAYDTYVKLKNNPLILKAEVTTTDPSMDPIRLGKSMMMPKDYFTKLIEHLDHEEQEELRDIFQEYKNLRGAIIRAGRDAFISLPKKQGSESNQLLRSKSLELIELFGSFLSTDQVYKIVTGEWGMEINRHPLNQFQVDYEREINKKKEEYKTEWSALKLSHRRGRLEELQELYFDRKGIYLEEGKNRLDYIQLIQTIKIIKEECQDPTLKIEHHISGRIEATINQTIKEDILKNLPILEIIVGRVASSLKVNPSTILERLHSSIYAKFSGVETTSLEDLKEQPLYPSQMVYDWTAIGKMHEIEQPIQDIEYQEVSSGELLKGKKMLEILSQKVLENKNYLTLINHTITRNIENS